MRGSAFMIEVCDISKKFVKTVGKNKKKEFYADCGLSFRVKEGTILELLVRMVLVRQHFLGCYLELWNLVVEVF